MVVTDAPESRLQSTVMKRVHRVTERGEETRDSSTFTLSRRPRDEKSSQWTQIAGRGRGVFLPEEDPGEGACIDVSMRHVHSRSGFGFGAFGIF